MYLTMHTLDGDPAGLIDRKQRHFDPVVRRIAPAYGAIASITAETEAGLTVLNLWQSKDRVAEFTARPEIQAARDAAQLPPPSSFRRYERVIIELYTSSSAASSSGDTGIGQ